MEELFSVTWASMGCFWCVVAAVIGLLIAKATTSGGGGMDSGCGGAVLMLFCGAAGVCGLIGAVVLLFIHLSMVL